MWTKDMDICPGMTIEEHAESVAQFLGEPVEEVVQRIIDQMNSLETINV